MSTTNHTVNYELSQYIGTDVTSYLSNYNSDMYKIDAQMKENADDAAEAKSDAAAAVATSTTAASNASAAVSTANAANTTAEAAQTAATAAQTAAGAAQTTAEAALEASASNTIGNLAPAYDPTLTYAVGDLVTYVDPETNQGKLYKCIVAIVTPEAFNINKWDDVTTSEAYNLKSRKITFNSSNYSSTSDILQAIYTFLSTNNIAECSITEHNVISNIDYISEYRYSGKDDTSYFFTTIAGTTDFCVNRILCLDNNASYIVGWRFDVAGNTKSTADLTTNTRSYEIIY